MKQIHFNHDCYGCQVIFDQEDFYIAEPQLTFYGFALKIHVQLISWQFSLGFLTTTVNNNVFGRRLFSLFLAELLVLVPGLQIHKPTSI